MTAYRLQSADDIDTVLTAVVHSDASDVYIQPERYISFRIGGKIMPSDCSPTTPQVEAMVDKVLSTPGSISKLIDGESDVAYELKVRDAANAYKFTESHRFRMNISLAEGLPCIVARRLKIVSSNIDEFGIPRRFCDLIKKIPYGLFLVIGTTGSGKSTTLASIISHIMASKSSVVITIEDPIEYKLFSETSLVMQREVGTDTKTFSTGLRSAMRQNPDIILVGEIRDTETAISAIQAANTGIKVFSTLHSSSVTEAISRISNMFPPEKQSWARSEMSSITRGIMMQTLVPTANACTGRKRLLCTEVMEIVSENAISLCRRNESLALRQMLLSSEIGWTLNQSLLNASSQGLIAKDSVPNYTNNADELKSLIDAKT